MPAPYASLVVHSRATFFSLFWLMAICLVSGQTATAASNQKPPQRSEIFALRSELVLLHDSAEQLKNVVMQTFPQGQSAFAYNRTAPRWSQESLRAMLSAGITPEQVHAWAKTLRTEAGYWQRRQAAQATRLIDEDDIEVDPAVCKSSSWAEVFGLLQSVNTVETLLAGAKWFCRQEEGGFNAALVCLPMEETAAVLKNAQRTSAICLGAQGSGRADATLENLHEMVELGNEKLNTTVSSRSSEEQVDTVKDDTQNVQDTLDDYLPANLPQIQNKLDTLIGHLQDNEQLLLDALVRLQDLSVRGLLLQAEAEDQAQRLADTQQIMTEIRQDTQAIKGQLTGVDTQIDQNATARHMAFNRLRKQRMAAILLADTDGVTVEFQVPALFGGQLEVVRDFVWSHLQLAQNAGLNVAMAMQTFSDGDTALNAGDYHQAYFNYAKAYRNAVNTAAP